MIHKQRDVDYIEDLSTTINEIQHILKTTVNDLASTRPSKIGTVYGMQKQVKKMLLSNELKKLSSILSARFNINIKVKNSNMKNMKLSGLILPLINSTTVNVALININKLFPNKEKGGRLWEITGNMNEKIVHDTLKDLTSALQSDKLNIDLENSKIYGLSNNSTFIINIDFLSSTVISLTASEISSMLVYEVGRIFAYINRLTTTTNNNYTLLSTFVNERFTKGTEPIKSISLALKKTTGKLNNGKAMSVLEALDSYILESQELDSDTRAIKLDYQHTADIFVTRFNLATEFARAIAKQASNGIVKIDDSDSITGSVIVGAATSYLKILLTAISFVIFASIGMVVALAYAAGKLLLVIINYTVVMLYNLLKTLLNIEEDSPSFETVGRRLDNIVLELKRQLRTLDINKEDEAIIVEQIDTIKIITGKLKDNVNKLNKYGYTDSSVDLAVTLNRVVEELEENDLYLMSSKFNQL